MNRRIKTAGGYEIEEVPLADPSAASDNEIDDFFWVEHKPDDDHIRFPDEENFESMSILNDFGEFARTGTARHVFLKAGLLQVNQIDLGYPMSRTGFSARQLQVAGADDDWLGEVIGVLGAHGWNDGHVFLSDEIVERVRKAVGQEVIDDARETHGENWRAFILEVAAAYFVRPLTRLWYAANLVSLYFVHQDDMTFGYLWAEYNVRLRHETDAVRGSKTKKSASAGGRVRGSKFSAQRQKVVSEIERLVQVGHSVSRASHLVFANGHGTSAEANRKLFYRARKEK